MKRIYLTVLTTEIETEPLGVHADDPLQQSAVATYLASAIEDGMTKEDSRDRLLDERTYALGECIGSANATHGPVRAIGRREEGDIVYEGDLVYWCKTCGALKGKNGSWEFPEIRIDKKEK